MKKEWLEHDAKVKGYHRQHRFLGLFKTGINLLVFLLGFSTLLFSKLEKTLAFYTDSHWVLWIFFFAIVGGGLYIIGLPFSILSQRLERQYHLSKQSWPSWFGDQAKGIGVASIIGLIFLGTLHAAQEMFPSRWWLAFWFFTILISLGLARIAPTLLIPLFFKLKPLEDGELKQRLLHLGDRFGVKTAEVYHLGLGAKTEKGNAAFVGLGKTKRILLGDTFYERFPANEIEAVFAHELGHQVHSDMWRGMAVNAAISFCSFFAAFKLLQIFLSETGRNPSQPVAVLFFFVAIGFIQSILGPIEKFLSRVWEHQADHFAAKEFKMHKELASALEKLTIQNFGEFKPNPILEFLFYTHPAPYRRITALSL